MPPACLEAAGGRSHRADNPPEPTTLRRGRANMGSGALAANIGTSTANPQTKTSEHATRVATPECAYWWKPERVGCKQCWQRAARRRQQHKSRFYPSLIIVGPWPHSSTAGRHLEKVFCDTFGRLACWWRKPRRWRWRSKKDEGRGKRIDPS